MHTEVLMETSPLEKYAFVFAENRSFWRGGEGVSLQIREHFCLFELIVGTFVDFCLKIVKNLIGMTCMDITVCNTSAINV